MKKLLSIPATLVLMLVLAGPIAPGVAHAQPANCNLPNSPNHCVDVVIIGGQIQPIANVGVPGKNHHIYWVIKNSPGFTFPPPPHSDAVTWKPANPPYNDNGSMPPNEFAGCGRTIPTVFHCPDANSTHGSVVRTYQYTMTVVDPAGNDVLLDPWVINR